MASRFLRTVAMTTTACSECGATILHTTAEANGGRCIPCRRGERAAIEQSKQYYRNERIRNAMDPGRALWRRLVHQVYNQPDGFASLTGDERVFFAVGVLEGDVYNGGFHQYFHNSGGGYYAEAERGLDALGAINALRILRQAKSVVFGSGAVPTDQGARWDHLSTIGEAEREALGSLDSEFRQDGDAVGSRLELFVRSHLLH